MDSHADDDLKSTYAQDETPLVRPARYTHTYEHIHTHAPTKRTALTRLFSCGLVVLALLVLAIPIDTAHPKSGKTSHFWGQYSPFFSLSSHSAISPATPPTCTVTFVQVLSRHGARYPTTNKGEQYAELVERIHNSATEYRDVYAALGEYRYRLGADDLTPFGERQMAESGAALYARYAQLGRANVPFLRASGSARVVASGALFSRGFNDAKRVDEWAERQKESQVNLVIPEGPQWNNTLDTGACESDSPSHAAQEEFLAVFAPPILERLVSNMPGVELSLADIPLLMDLCPFESVAQSHQAPLHPLCALFTPSEWRSYDYYNTLGKYYASGTGNPLASSRGVGYVNELIARMTKSAVRDHTSVNHTLDSDPATFPLDTPMYADFTHDNAMVAIFDAFGLYNATAKLSTSHVQSAVETRGFSSSWLVPFAARAYFELMQCAGDDESAEGEEEMVRVLVNDRVVPLHGCTVDALGRCRLDEWIRGLGFARNGGRWDDYCSIA